MTAPSSFDISTYSPYSIAPTILNTTNYDSTMVSVSKTSSGSSITIDTSGLPSSATNGRSGAIVIQEFVAGKIDSFVFSLSINRSFNRNAIRLLDLSDNSSITISASSSGWYASQTSFTISGLLSNASIKKRHRYALVAELITPAVSGNNYTATITGIVAS